MVKNHNTQIELNSTNDKIAKSSHAYLQFDQDW